MHFLSTNVLYRFSFLLPVALLGVLCGPIHAADVVAITADKTVATSKAIHYADPLQKWNRKVFAFNEVFDKYLLKPVAQTYDWLLPQFADDAVTRIFHNLLGPRDLINAYLQGEWLQGTQQTGRFLLNSTVGVVGVFDVARHTGLQAKPEDLGLTMAHWGLPQGPYLVLPLLGPATTRHAATLYPSGYLSPLWYIDDKPTLYGAVGLGVINLRADFLGFEDAVIGDKYSFFRTYYLQKRQYQLGANAVEDDFGSELEDDSCADDDCEDDDW